MTDLRAVVNAIPIRGYDAGRKIKIGLAATAELGEEMEERHFVGEAGL